MIRINRRNRGMTLIELVVVVAILAVLALIVIPKLDGLQGNANHAVGATSASDTARYIQTYRTMKQRFPDGWDSLMDSSGMWNSWNPGTKTKGLHNQLGGSTGKLAEYTLTANEVGSLNNAGIYTLYNVDTTLTNKRPSDMFTLSTPIAAGSKVAVVNSGSSGGINIINHIYRQNLSSGGTSGALPTGKVLVALGFGAQNGLIGSLMLEAPMYPNVDTSLVYGRNLALFEVSTTSATTRAIFKGVVAADGDLLDDLSTYMSKDI